MITFPSNIYFVLSDIYSLVDKFVKFTNEDADVHPLYKLVILLGSLFIIIIKVIKLLHNIPKASIIWFTTYYPHYKEKLGTTKSIYKLFFL